MTSPARTLNIFVAPLYFVWYTIYDPPPDYDLSAVWRAEGGNTRGGGNTEIDLFLRL